MPAHANGAYVIKPGDTVVTPCGRPALVEGSPASSVRSVRVADLLVEETGSEMFLRGVGDKVVADAARLGDREIEDHPAQAIISKPDANCAASQQPVGDSEEKQR